MAGLLLGRARPGRGGEVILQQFLTHSWQRESLRIPSLSPRWGASSNFLDNHPSTKPPKTRRSDVKASLT
jgi:hypothetical protein